MTTILPTQPSINQIALNCACIPPKNPCPSIKPITPHINKSTMIIPIADLIN